MPHRGATIGPFFLHDILQVVATSCSRKDVARCERGRRAKATAPRNARLPLPRAFPPRITTSRQSLQAFWGDLRAAASDMNPAGASAALPDQPPFSHALSQTSPLRRKLTGKRKISDPPPAKIASSRSVAAMLPEKHARGLPLLRRNPRQPSRGGGAFAPPSAPSRAFFSWESRRGLTSIVGGVRGLLSSPADSTPLRMSSASFLMAWMDWMMDRITAGKRFGPNRIRMRPSTMHSSCHPGFKMLKAAVEIANGAAHMSGSFCHAASCQALPSTRNDGRPEPSPGDDESRISGRLSARRGIRRSVESVPGCATGDFRHIAGGAPAPPRRPFASDADSAYRARPPLSTMQEPEENLGLGTLASARPEPGRDGRLGRIALPLPSPSSGPSRSGRRLGRTLGKKTGFSFTTNMTLFNDESLCVRRFSRGASPAGGRLPR